MAIHRIHKGLDLPIGTAPEQRISTTTVRVGSVALLADDYPGLRPRLRVQEGDQVLRGQLLFEDRKNELVRFTAPSAGKVVHVHRGARRSLSSVVIARTEAARDGHAPDAEQVSFESFHGKSVAELGREEVVALLVESGLWTALRTRPFSRVPAVQSTPHALFVTAIDTQPLAPSPRLTIAAAHDDFQAGVRVLSKLPSGTTYVCVAEASDVPADLGEKVRVECFVGPHPAGLPGLHIHRLAPVTRERVAWHIGYQDVIAVGRLFRTGKLDCERVISIAGPAIAQPRLVRTCLGASLDDLTREDELPAFVRLISGSVLSGKRYTSEAFGYLGRYERQVSALMEERERQLLGWLAPGSRTFSVIPVFLSKWLRKRTFDFTTSTHGSKRAMVPIGLYEKVMPMDILPTFLLRSLLVGDTERAEELGALELDEEDLSLCTFVCPSKIDYGPVLRENLNRMEAGV